MSAEDGLAEWVRASRAALGLPERVTDPVALAAARNALQPLTDGNGATKGTNPDDAVTHIHAPLPTTAESAPNDLPESA